MDICLFGGTFNPIHNGHIGMCLETLKHYDFDKFYIIPAGDSYFKTNVTSTEHRANMVKLALEEINDKRIEFSDVEINRKGPSYSIDTIMHYKHLYENADIYFLIGEDTIFNILKWYKAKEIFGNVHLIILKRTGYSNEDFDNYIKLLTKKYLAKIDVIDYSYDISSSQIRNMLISKDAKVKNFLAAKVLNYINDNKLW